MRRGETGYVFDPLDPDETNWHGTTDFWGGPDDGVTTKGRTCAVRGDALYDYAKGNLCHVCIKRKKSSEIQAMVAHLVEAAQAKRIRDWWEASENALERENRLRVVGITLCDEDTAALLEAL